MKTYKKLFTIIITLIMVFSTINIKPYADSEEFEVTFLYRGNKLNDIEYFKVVEADSNTIIWNTINPKVEIQEETTVKINLKRNQEYFVIYKHFGDLSELQADNFRVDIATEKNFTIDYGSEVFSDGTNLDVYFEDEDMSDYTELSELVSNIVSVKVIQTDNNYRNFGEILIDTEPVKEQYLDIGVEEGLNFFVEYALYTGDVFKSQIIEIQQGENELRIPISNVTHEIGNFISVNPSVIKFEDRFIDYTDKQEGEIEINSVFEDSDMETTVTVTLESLKESIMGDNFKNFIVELPDGTLVGKYDADNPEIKDKANFKLKGNQKVTLKVYTGKEMYPTRTNIPQTDSVIFTNSENIPMGSKVGLFFTIRHRPLGNFTHDIRVTPNEIEFDDFVENTLYKGERKNITIENTGDLTLNNVLVKYPWSLRYRFTQPKEYIPDFLNNTILFKTIKPKETIEISFSPKDSLDSGIYNDTILVKTMKIEGDITKTVNTNFRVTSLPKEWELTPNLIDFGRKPVGYTITNQDEKPLKIINKSNLEITGFVVTKSGNLDNFTLLNDSNGVILFPQYIRVQPNSFANLKVKPKEGLPEGKYEASLSLENGGLTKTVRLLFKVGDSDKVTDFEIKPANLNFKDAEFGYKLPEEIKIKIKNTGDNIIKKLTLENQDKFDVLLDNSNIGFNESNNMAKNQELNLTVKPKIGLPVGDNSLELKFDGDGVTRLLPVKFKVFNVPEEHTSKGEPPKSPVRPDNTISITTPEPQEEKPTIPNNETPPENNNEVPPTTKEKIPGVPEKIIKPPKTGIR